MTTDKQPNNKTSIIIGALVGVVVTLAAVLVFILTGQTDAPSASDADADIHSEEMADNEEHMADAKDEDDSEEVDEDPDTVSSATVHYEYVENPDEGWDTTYSYPYPYSDVTNRHSIPYAEDLRDLLVEKGLEQADDSEKTDAINEHFGEYTSSYLQTGMIPSRSYSSWVIDAMRDLSDIDNWEGVEDFDDLNGPTTVDPWTVNYVFFKNGEPDYRDVHVEVDSGYLTSIGHERSGEFVEIDELVVGGLHLHQTELVYYGIEGFPGTDSVDMDASQFADDVDLSGFMNGLFRNDFLVRITYFVRPARRMNKVEFLERAKQLSFDLNGHATEEIPHLFDEDYETLHHFFGSDHQSRRGSDGTFQTYDSYIDYAPTILPMGHVAMMHQYVPAQALLFHDNVLTVNGHEFLFPRELEPGETSFINITDSLR